MSIDIHVFWNYTCNVHTERQMELVFCTHGGHGMPVWKCIKEDKYAHFSFFSCAERSVRCSSGTRSFGATGSTSHCSRSRSSYSGLVNNPRWREPPDAPARAGQIG